MEFSINTLINKADTMAIPNMWGFSSSLLVLVRLFTHSNTLFLRFSNEFGHNSSGISGSG